MTTTTEIRNIFSTAKTIDSPVLNRIGVQPFRTVASHALHRARRPSPDLNLDELTRTGLLMVEDFLPPEEFAEVVRQTDAYADSHEPDYREFQGTTDVRQYYLRPGHLGGYPALEECRNGRAVVQYLEAAERQPIPRRDLVVAIELVTQGDGSTPDPMHRFHIDTFHHTYKAWLFLDDVHDEDGPFVFVPGSHHVDLDRLRYDYADSVNDNMRSRLASDEEIERRGLERRPVTGAANTLAIADTCGYHARGVGEAGRSRRTLHFYSRTNPFRLGTMIPDRIRAVRRSA